MFSAIHRLFHHRLRTRWRVAAATAAMASLAVCAAAAQGVDAPAGTANGAGLVNTQRFADVAIHPQREAAAAVLARNESKVAAEVSGRLLRWTREVGESVARGALLAEIDPSDYRLAIDRARAALQASQARHELARTQLQRARELVAQGFLSQEVVNQRETEMQALAAEITANRSQLATAQLQLERTRVTAPFAASVTQRLAQTGEFVTPGTPLYVLTESGAAEVSAALAPADVPSVRAAKAWSFEGTAGSAPLVLLRIAPTVNAPARTVDARFRFASPDVAVAPGSEGRLRWRDPRRHLPAELIVRRTVDGHSRLGVFVAESGRARFVVLPGAQEGRAAPARLADDAQVVVRGQTALTPGQPLPARLPAAALTPPSTSAR
jgi:RND family efflux transporter MFP subunit